tara:strand:- start:808 stop:996 length:189 start_codon:yes stop_codon:yes gene_type:complete
MAWNNNDLSDSQYVKQLRYYQSSEEMGELKKEIKKIKNCHENDSKNKKKGILGRIMGIFGKS